MRNRGKVKLNVYIYAKEYVGILYIDTVFKIETIILFKYCLEAS